MPKSMSSDWERRLEIPGRISLVPGKGGLPIVKVQTEWSAAEIYLHGAHVAHFQKNGEPPLLFLSEKSQFKEAQPIRGGVPVIFPWFGPREGETMHGFARLRTWELQEIALASDGRILLRLRLPDCPEAAKVTPFALEFTVSVGEALEMTLAVTNTSKDRDFMFEDCLHTYFMVGDINAVSIIGLKGRTYVDKVDDFQKKREAGDAIYISTEVNRIYEDTSGPIEIVDTKLRRRVRMETQGADSTVVWNPWIARAKEMPDFGDEEYLRMVCVESGNVAKNHVTLGPGRTASLRVKLSTAAV
jgi:D-hexose-6-phosphate mutarotase